jgi:hypothetical protein
MPVTPARADPRWSYLRWTGTRQANPTAALTDRSPMRVAGRDWTRPPLQRVGHFAGRYAFAASHDCHHDMPDAFRGSGANSRGAGCARRPEPSPGSPGNGIGSKALVLPGPSPGELARSRSAVILIRNVYERSKKGTAGGADPVRFHGRAPRGYCEWGRSCSWAKPAESLAHGPQRLTIVDFPSSGRLLSFSPFEVCGPSGRARIKTSGSI